MYSRLSWILIRIQKRKHMVCFFYILCVITHTRYTCYTHFLLIIYMYYICDIENDIITYRYTHTYIHVTYIYTCRYVAKVDSVHCSPPTPNYINDKIYSCVQFLSSTSLTQTKKNTFVNRNWKRKNAWNLLINRPVRQKMCLDSRSDKQGESWTWPSHYQYSKKDNLWVVTL